MLVARLPDGYGARITITNHPIGGPVFSGPQIQPWQCQSGAADKQCDQTPSYAYYYVPAGQSGSGSNTAGQGSGSFVSYDPNNPPPNSAIATTTTTDGVTVPFIIRQETGYIDRDQYAIATLWQPGKPGSPGLRSRQYNGRLVITHGASCDTTYGTGSAPSVQDQKILAGGFIVMSTALDNAGHNCNLLTEAESLEMTKEWVVDHYGEIRVDDRLRLLGRLARPAAGGQRLSGDLPGHHPAVQLHRRLVLGHGVRGLLHAPQLLREQGPRSICGRRTRSAP